jgi:anti-sigma regulatory factor (Ser/Thr protein kinase)/predicted hydrocarbon binding protein
MRSHRRVAVGLLDALDAAGEPAPRARALAALDVPEEALRTGSCEVSAGALGAAFRAAGADRGLGRRVGRALVRPAPLSFLLRYSGVGSPEKAYRRCDHFLPRESAAGAYRAEIAGARTRVVYETGPGEERCEAFCGMREGMLEAVPLLFGLPDARVRETECAGRGGARCAYEVRWSRVPRTGLVAGALGGGLAGALAVSWLLGASLGAGAAAALLLAVLGATAGRSFDLVRQLEAGAEARRAARELLDHAERALSEKMDELAKLSAWSDAGEGRRPAPVRQAPAHSLSSLAAVVRRGVAAMRGELPADVELELDLDEEGTALACDPFQIEQVVQQLLRNAVAAAGAAGRPGRVRVALRALANAAEIAVEDNGPGISQEVVERLFDPYVTPPVAGGEVGFGLPVSCRILQAHGGELRVESEPERGTRVSAILPRSEPQTALS